MLSIYNLLYIYFTSLNLLYLKYVNVPTPTNPNMLKTSPIPAPACGKLPVAVVESCFPFVVLFVPLEFCLLLEFCSLFLSLVELFVEAATTVTVQVAFLLPSCDVTVIIVDPIFLGVTFPALSTVATDSSLDVHVTILFVAFDGLKVGFNVKVFPNSTLAVLASVIPSNAISGCKLSTKIYMDIF